MRQSGASTTNDQATNSQFGRAIAAAVQQRGGIREPQRSEQRISVQPQPKFGQTREQQQTEQARDSARKHPQSQSINLTASTDSSSAQSSVTPSRRYQYRLPLPKLAVAAVESTSASANRFSFEGNSTSPRQQPRHDNKQSRQSHSNKSSNHRDKSAPATKTQSTADTAASSSVATLAQTVVTQIQKSTNPIPAPGAPQNHWPTAHCPARARGCFDYFASKSQHYAYVERELMSVARLHAFRECRTPTLEHAQLFERSLGQDSDLLVQKEMFSLDDSGIPLTLKPEGTASVARALIEQGFNANSPVQRHYYVDSMFRRERTQRGRYRQFRQFGIECVQGTRVGQQQQHSTGATADSAAINLAPGPVPESALADVECIALGWQCMQHLGVAPHLTLHLNSLGTFAERRAYNEALQAFFEPRVCLLSPESVARVKSGSLLRILHSKDVRDRRVVTGELNEGTQIKLCSASPILDRLGQLADRAPLLSEFWSFESKAHFEAVQTGLRQPKLPFTVSPYLMRGLNYYSHTAYEWIIHDETPKYSASVAATDAWHAPRCTPRGLAHLRSVEGLIAVGVAVAAGGRYDSLFDTLGLEKHSVAACGCAAGEDRLVLLRETLQIAEPQSQAQQHIGIIVVHKQSTASIFKSKSDTSDDDVIDADDVAAAEDSEAAISAPESPSDSSNVPTVKPDSDPLHYSLQLAAALRQHGFSVLTALHQKNTRQQASALSDGKARLCIFIGDSELEQCVALVKDYGSPADANASSESPAQGQTKHDNKSIQTKDGAASAPAAARSHHDTVEMSKLVEYLHRKLSECRETDRQVVLQRAAETANQPLDIDLTSEFQMTRPKRSRQVKKPKQAKPAE